LVGATPLCARTRHPSNTIAATIGASTTNLMRTGIAAPSMKN
jgi:hypothetical protein